MTPDSCRSGNDKATGLALACHCTTNILDINSFFAFDKKQKKKGNYADVINCWVRVRILSNFEKLSEIGDVIKVNIK
jgi:hypothetical protein